MDLTGSLLAVTLVLVRVVGFFMWLPVIGGEGVPSRVRLGFGVAVTLAVVSFVPPPAVTDQRLSHLVVALVSEVGLGISAGLITKMFFLALEGAGHAAGNVMGMGFAQTFNPVTGTQSNPLSKLLTLSGMAFALHQGFHAEAIAWLAHSLVVFPVGEAPSWLAVSQGLVTHALGSIVLAVRLGFPVVGAVTLGHITLGLLGRTAPQLNLQAVGFSIAVVAGGVVVYQSVYDIGRAAAEAMVHGLWTLA